MVIEFYSNSILNQLHALANPSNVAGMAHYGINLEHALGISVSSLRKIAKEIGTNHSLAQELWDSGIHEARRMPGKEYKHGENRLEFFLQCGS